MFRFALHARCRSARVISLGLLAALITLGAGPVFAQTRFTPQQLREDLASMRAHLDEVHPDVWHSVAPTTLTRAFDPDAAIDQAAVTACGSNSSR